MVWRQISGASAVIALAIILLISNQDYVVTENTYYCADEPENLSECDFGISNGKGTRCYLDEAQSTWNSCGTGWERALDYVEDVLLIDYNCTDLLVASSDTSFTDVPEAEMSPGQLKKFYAGNTRQGYIIDKKFCGEEWGNLEMDPKRAIHILIDSVYWNDSWIQSERDENGTVVKDREFRIPIESLLSQQEKADLDGIGYNGVVNWSLTLDYTGIDISSYVDKFLMNEMPTVKKRHGSSGNFTICPSGCNYTSISNFESNENANLTGTGPAIAEITEGFEETALITIEGWTTTEDDYIRIYTAENARHNGVFDSNMYHLNVSVFNPALSIREDFTRIEGVQISNPNVGGEGISINLDGDTLNSNIILSHNIIKDIGTEAIAMGGDDYNFTVYNNIIYDADTCFENYNYVDSLDIYWELYSNTMFNCTTYGVRTYTQGNLIAKNNLVVNGTDDWSGTLDSSSTNNSYSDGVDPGGNGNLNLTDVSLASVFVDYANRNFSLVSGSDAIDAGVTINAFDTDIIGTSRPQGDAWDIGAFEYITLGVDNGTFTVTLLNSTDFNATNSSSFSFSVNVSCDSGGNNCGLVNVTLDPVIQLQTADTENLDDGYSRSAAPTTEYGANTFLIIEDDGTNNRTIAIKYNISSIPIGQVIDDSILLLYLETNEMEISDELTIAAYFINESFDWVEGTGDSSGDSCTGIEYCHDNKPSSNEIFNQSSTLIFDENNGTGTFYSWNVTNIVREAYSKSLENISIFLLVTARVNTASFDRLLFTSKEGATSANRPYLNITYSELAPQSKGVIPEDAGSPFYVNSAVTNNPDVTTCDLNAGSSCTVTWEVHTNGTVDYVYEFFAFGNTSYQSNTSGIVNVTIIAGVADTCATANPLCSDDCSISSPLDFGGSDYHIIGSTGSYTSSVQIIADRLIIDSPGCDIAQGDFKTG